MRVSYLFIAATLSACAGAASNPDGLAEAEPVLTLTSEGLQGLPTTVPVNAIEIQRVYPELEVESSAYGKRYAIRLAGETLALVEPAGATGYRAKLLSAKTTGPRGIRVGDLFPEVGSLSGVQCRRGSGEWASQIYCTSAATEHVVYGFDADQVPTGDCVADCAVSDLSGLQTAKIRMIDWQP